MKRTRLIFLFVAIVMLAMCLAACVQTKEPPAPSDDISVTITNTDRVYLDELLDGGFAMQVQVNANDTSVTYHLTDAGNFVGISDDGWVTINNNVPEWYTFEVSAVSNVNPGKSDCIEFTVLKTRLSMDGTGQIGQVIASVNGDPSVSRGVSWFTSADIEDSDLLLSTDKSMKNAKLYTGNANSFSKYATESDADLNLAKKTYYNHKVTVEGLQPDTTYYYKVGSQRLGLFSDVCSFKTTGTVGYTANLFITTDVHYGASENNQNKYYHAALSDAIKRFGTIDMAVDCGDFKSQWKVGYRYYYFEEEWIKAMASISPLLRTTTFVPLNGNHDNNIDANNGEFDYAFFNHYNVPNSPEAISDGQRKGVNYSFDVGAAHIVMLSYTDEHGDITDAQKQWLQDDLQNTTKTWKFVFSHVGLTDAVKAIVEKCGVDVAFSGHEHFYRHSKPMLNGVAQTITAKAEDKNVFVDQVGTTYVTNSTTGGADSWEDVAMGENDLCAFGLGTNMAQVKGYLPTDVTGTLQNGWGMYSVLTVTDTSAMVSVYIRPSPSASASFILLHTYGFEKTR